MELPTLQETPTAVLRIWLERSEETGRYRGYSRHEIAMEFFKRVRKNHDMKRCLLT